MINIRDGFFQCNGNYGENLPATRSRYHEKYADCGRGPSKRKDKDPPYRLEASEHRAESHGPHSGSALWINGVGKDCDCSCDCAEVSLGRSRESQERTNTDRPDSSPPPLSRPRQVLPQPMPADHGVSGVSAVFIERSCAPHRPVVPALAGTKGIPSSHTARRAPPRPSSLGWRLERRHVKRCRKPSPAGHPPFKASPGGTLRLGRMGLGGAKDPGDGDGDDGERRKSGGEPFGSDATSRGTGILDCTNWKLERGDRVHGLLHCHLSRTYGLHSRALGVRLVMHDSDLSNAWVGQRSRV